MCRILNTLQGSERALRRSLYQLRTSRILTDSTEYVLQVFQEITFRHCSYFRVQLFMGSPRQYLKHSPLYLWRKWDRLTWVFQSLAFSMDISWMEPSKSMIRKVSFTSKSFCDTNYLFPDLSRNARTPEPRNMSA